MESIQARLISRRQLAEDTFEITLALREILSFTPGQYVGLTIPTLNVSDPHAKRRDLSIVSPAGSKNIILAFRTSASPFKQALLSKNPELMIHGPHGIFTLPTEINTSLTFIAGGIGLTPFLSMISSGLSTPITVLAVDSTAERVAYADELGKLGSSQTTIKRRIGRINTLAELRGEIPIESSGVFFVSGPPAFTSHIRSLLREAAVSPFSIYMEEFTGYGTID